MRDRRSESHFKQHRLHVTGRTRSSRAVDFFNVLTSPDLLSLTDAQLPEHRERLYPPTVTLSMFIQQILDSDKSCQHAVDCWALQRVADGLSPSSTDTGAYCKARKRLPVAMLRTLTQQTGGLLSERASADWRWRNRPVKLVDGTTISMPDTIENQHHNPSPRTQANGVGFPMSRVVGVVCLSTGALLAAAHGPFVGKGQGEAQLFRRLTWALSPGDILLGDALYCHYFLMAAMQAAKVDVVFEQLGARRTDFRRGQRLGVRDHVVRWRKPDRRPSWMSADQYDATPDTLTVREARVNGRVLVSTLCDARSVRKSALNDLYSRRWNVELDLRNIKTTLGMSVLRCRTPSMIEKEIWVHLLAYNLIRILMAQAAREAGVHPRELSFKHAVQLWTIWLHLRLSVRDAHATSHLLRFLADRKVGHRGGRAEPRARKRRPKYYPWLQIPRDLARKRLSSCSKTLNA